MVMFTGQAYAQINSPVPSDAYIVYGGLDWAWGGPCPYSGGCYATGDLTYQGTQGWRLPSAAEMAIVDALDGAVLGSVQSATFANLFLNNGGNVPVGGTDMVSGASFSSGSGGSCATPYFTGAATWCDDGDGLQGLWAGSQIASSSGEAFYGEQLYVKSAIPEPSTWAMMLIGFASLGFAGYRRAKIELSALKA